MCTAMDVANFFIDLANDDPEEFMTNLRINKLLYFAQGWSVARTGKPLFDDAIEAWSYGPVVPSVYHAFKSYGANAIRDCRGKYDHTVFSSEEISLLLDVFRDYGKYTAPALLELTHEPGSPWAKVFENGENHVITPRAMAEYFRKEDPLSEFKMPELPTIGYRDPEDGRLVLPDEYDN